MSRRQNDDEFEDDDVLEPSFPFFPTCDPARAIHIYAYGSAVAPDPDAGDVYPPDGARCECGALKWGEARAQYRASTQPLRDLYHQMRISVQTHDRATMITRIAGDALVAIKDAIGKIEKIDPATKKPLRRIERELAKAIDASLIEFEDPNMVRWIAAAREATAEGELTDER